MYFCCARMATSKGSTAGEPSVILSTTGGPMHAMSPKVMYRMMIGWEGAQTRAWPDVWLGRSVEPGSAGIGASSRGVIG